ncbi:hypothetical protein EAE99_000806 [Botrytis elliptica]|nr:hypothetical protein EAE99_000806 [Botrytis elliptica]
MLPSISLQTSPKQQKNTSGSPVASSSRKLPSMPPSSTSVQCQTQVPTQVSMGQQTPQAQQSAATSKQFTRAGYFTSRNLIKQEQNSRIEQMALEDSKFLENI